jgi:two-component system, OmpR family, sensor histidine kinase KdpD
MRTALLRAVSHDLRSPLVSGLRVPGVELTSADRDKLLDTAAESLEQLSRLAGSLLDLTRLQAGARPVFPRPSDLGEIITHALAGLGPPGRAVRVDLPPGLPAVMADPPLMERVIANLTGNALRYSPAGGPPRLSARARGGRVELRVDDRGPGVPPGAWDTMFAPFQRLGDPGSATGIGLGLAVARGLDRGDARHAGTGGNSWRWPDHDHVHACRPPPHPAGARLARIGGSRPMTTIAGRRPPSAWNCRCGTGTLASMASGVASSRPSAPSCAAAGPPAKAGDAGRPAKG